MARRKSAEQRSKAPLKKPRQRRAKRPAPKAAPEPARNGTAPAEPITPPPTRPDGTTATAPDLAVYRPGNSRAGSGRLLRDVRADAPAWFREPWVSRRNLTLVVGVPRAGKSTFGAWMLSQAVRPAILPGPEEDTSTSLAPRLLMAGVDPDHCLILDDRAWRLPTDRHALTQVLRDHHCDCLWVDPIDTFCGIYSENDADGVAEALEAFCRLAHDVDCAVVAARHPGKNINNICPGSRKWRSTPREVIELRYDEGPPERRWMRLTRDPYRSEVGPHTYSLDGPAGVPPVFVLGEPIGLSQCQTWGIGDQVDMWRIDEAEQLLRLWLAEAEQEVQWIYGEGLKRGLDPKTIRYAARRIGLTVSHENQGRETRSVYPQVPPSGGAPP